MAEAKSNITLELASRLYRLYRLSAIFFVSAIVLGIIGWVLEYMQSGRVFPFEGYTFHPMNLLLGVLLGLPGLIYWLRGSKRLVTEGDRFYLDIEHYRKLFSLQMLLGSLCTVGAILMLLGGLILIQLGPAGAAILLVLFSGAIIHRKILKLNKLIEGE